MGNGNLQRDGAQVNQKARPKNERQWQLPPIPDTGGEFWGCTRTFSVNHLAATPTSPRAARAPLHLSRCIAASDSNAAGWRDASGISQMSFSLLPPALPGSTTVPRPPPPFPLAPTSPAAAHHAAQIPTSTRQGMLQEDSSTPGLSPPLLAFSREQRQQEELPAEPIILHLGPIREPISKKTVSALQGEQRQALTSIIKVKPSTQVICMGNSML